MIRQATTADLQEITRIRTSVRENHLSVAEMAARGITEDGVAAEMRSGDLLAWVSCEADMTVAFAMARPDSGKLFALFTSPGHARRGHGTALLRTVEKSLSERGVRHISLDTGKGTAAIGFYLHNGYHVTGESNGDVFMSKTLAV